MLRQTPRGVSGAHTGERRQKTPFAGGVEGSRAGGVGDEGLLGVRLSCGNLPQEGGASNRCHGTGGVVFSKYVAGFVAGHGRNWSLNLETAPATAIARTADRTTDGCSRKRLPKCLLCSSAIGSRAHQSTETLMSAESPTTPPDRWFTIHQARAKSVHVKSHEMQFHPTSLTAKKPH